MEYLGGLVVLLLLAVSALNMAEARAQGRNRRD